MKINENRVVKRIGCIKEISCYKHITTNNGSDLIEKQAPILINIINISHKGIGITSSKDLEIGDLLIIKLETSKQIKEVMMEVKWCKYTGIGYEAGLRFMHLTEEGKLFLDKLIKEYIDKIERIYSRKEVK